MVFRLDAVDAYERKLVKQIEVASAVVEGDHNKPYVRLISTSNKKNDISAKVELDVQAKTGVQRKEVVVRDGDDLEQLTQRAVYANCLVGEIRAGKGKELLELRTPGDTHYLQPDQTFGGVAPLAMQRQMIHRTIKEHLDKEKRLRPQGIKVLSLFFIDSVEKYRQYDEAGNAVKGDYARIFEEEFQRLAKHPDYQTLFEKVDIASTAEAVHEGYFSIDKKKIGTKTVEVYKDTRGDTKVDDDTYNLIMRDKEKLLNLSTPLKFIFSHSALKEGWDNPNVFQICALREMSSERERRQTIGRGLRLCVNQAGERLRGFEVNTLTVIATESYEEFAEKLQKDIEDETGIRFGIVEPHQFAHISTIDAQGQAHPIGSEQSKALWDYLKAAELVDAKGKLQDKLKQALKDNTLVLPAVFAAHQDAVKDVLRKLAGKFEIKNADERISIKTRQANLNSEAFKALWERIRSKTTYRVHFDNEVLIEKCIESIRNAPAITKTRLQWRKADIDISRAGVGTSEVADSAYIAINDDHIVLPDILTDLQDKTQLTRRSLFHILTDSGRLNDFKRNPQQYIEIVAEAINRAKRLALVDGIKYERVGDSAYYAQELFQLEALTGYLKNVLKDTHKAVYEHLIYDSEVERTFAEDLEKNEAIQVYAKLPGWFKVLTPLGTYNPDWAIVVKEADGNERLYFVVETKSGLFTDDLRDKESAKIKCGEAHFAALAVGVENPARYKKKTTVADLLSDTTA